MSNDLITASSTSTRSPKVSFERERGVYAIQVTRALAHAVVSVRTEGERTERILQVFQILTAAGVPIFLIKLHRTAVTFALAGKDVEQAETAFRTAGFRVQMRHDLAMLVVKAASMRQVSGIMVDISDALYAAGAHLYGTGDSHDSVQCLIEATHVEVAVEQLCAVFDLDVSAIEERPLEREVAI